MLKNKQLIVDSKNGDCWRACITSILDVPNDPTLPNTSTDNSFMGWYKILESMGMFIYYEGKACWRNGFWIASVKSLNFSDCTHAIVMHSCEVAHDPSTKKVYETGEYLGGKDVVLGGYILEIIDPSLLWKYDEFKKKYNK